MILGFNLQTDNMCLISTMSNAINTDKYQIFKAFPYFYCVYDIIIRNVVYYIYGLGVFLSILKNRFRQLIRWDYMLFGQFA